MLKARALGLIVAACAVSLMLADTASAAAKKKMTYEEAWADCKKDLASTLPGDTAASAARYTRGAGCMKQHGYRLKKSSLSE